MRSGDESRCAPLADRSDSDEPAGSKDVILPKPLGTKMLHRLTNEFPLGAR
jgi:hypothetical protein